MGDACALRPDDDEQSVSVDHESPFPVVKALIFSAVAQRLDESSAEGKKGDSSAALSLFLCASALNPNFYAHTLILP